MRPSDATTCLSSPNSRRKKTSWNSGLLRSSRTRLLAGAPRAPGSLRPSLQQDVDVRLRRHRPRSPREAPCDAGPVGLLQRPQLALRHHRYARDQDASVLAPLEPQGLAPVTLAEGDLSALPHHLDLGAAHPGHDPPLLPAIMLSCQRAPRYASLAP